MIITASNRTKNNVDARIYTEMAALEDRHWWFVARRRILDKMLAGLPLPSDAQILEAGCGTGGNLAMLARYGHVYGMEANAEAIKLASAKGVAEVCAGYLPNDIPFPEKNFDLIVLFDVLEHLDDDAAALSALRARLKPGGWLLVTVPAFPFLWSGHDEIHHHKRRYRARSLRALTESAGYHVRYLSYFNTWLLPLIAVARLASGKEGEGSAGSMPNKFLNTLLTKIFASERFFLGHIAFPAGVSLLVMARNPE